MWDEYLENSRIDRYFWDHIHILTELHDFLKCVDEYLEITKRKR